ncbi:S1 family peptidase [Vibrio sp. TRT 17S01]|uniref:S1 family peptidase n=1 Tax=Vibrio sp. TRT 17S01 TaxID=3418505 RepID=UPI003CEC1476
MENKIPVLLAAGCLGLSFSSSASDVTPRIIGGTESPAGQWPFVTALVKASKSGGEGQFCGASYIGERYVMTATHCLTNTLAQDIEVIIGKQDLASATDADRYAIKRIYLHEDYDESSALQNDIAILELERDVAGGTAVTLAESTLRDALAPGQALTVMGWGDMDPSPAFDGPSKLHQVDVELINQDACTGAGDDYASIEVNAFCAGLEQGGKDSCQGDSGGPIIVNDGGVAKQLGIVSWGEGCAVAGQYGVYANVSHFADWIAEKTSGFSYDQINWADVQALGSYEYSFVYENNTGNSITLSSPTVTGGSIVSSTCDQPIASGSSCSVTINYTISDYGQSHAELVMNNDQGWAPIKSRVYFEGRQVASSGLANAVSIPKANVFSNGFEWRVEGSELSSAAIGDRQESALIITGIPQGSLTVDISVSSEPGYDDAFIFVNGGFIKRMTGVDRQTLELPLSNISGNKLEVFYVKDGSNAMNSDKVTIHSMRHSSQATPSDSGGGSFGLLTLFGLGLLFRRRQA